MWVTTTLGFFSVVRAYESDDVMIRSRVKKDLDALLDRFSVSRSGISFTPGNDYGYRVVVPIEVWSCWIAELALDIDYPNFKDAVKQKNPLRAKTYMHVWSDYHQIENEESTLRPLKQRARQEKMKNAKTDPRLVPRKR